ncbi:hypothetical protein OfM1_19710 [Lactovum odontotermitis]
MEVIKSAPIDDKKNLNTFLQSPYYEQLKSLALKGKTIDGYDHGEYFVVDNTDTPFGMEGIRELLIKLRRRLQQMNIYRKKCLFYSMPR